MELKSISKASLDWMPKEVWGPIKWRELHYRALTDLPMDDEAQWFAAFLENLPCPKCRGHFSEFLKTTPPDFSSRGRFFSWTVKAHNFVNRANGKKEYSEDEARRLQELSDLCTDHEPAGAA